MGNHEFVRELHATYGDTVRMRVEGRDVLFVRDPETVARVLGQRGDDNDFEKSFADADDKSSEYLQYFKNLVQPLLKSADIFGSGDNAGRRAALKRCFKASEVFVPAFDTVLGQELVRPRV